MKVIDVTNVIHPLLQFLPINMHKCEAAHSGGGGCLVNIVVSKKGAYS